MCRDLYLNFMNFFFLTVIIAWTIQTPNILICCIDLTKMFIWHMYVTTSNSELSLSFFSVVHLNVKWRFYYFLFDSLYDAFIYLGCFLD